MHLFALIIWRYARNVVQNNWAISAQKDLSLHEKSEYHDQTVHLRGLITAFPFHQ